MEIRQIECFLACCEHRSFTAAARSLNLVQSAVSTSVAKLEHELGVTLFDRTPRVLGLTDAGRAMIAPARSMLHARGEIVDAIDAARGQVRGEVGVGNLMNIHSIDLAGILADLRRRYPAVTVHMRQSVTGVTGNIAGLRDGTLDIALLGGVGAEIPGIAIHPIVEETLVLCTARHHPLAGRPFRDDDLADVRFVDFPPGWGIRGMVDARYPSRRTVIEVADQIFAMELAAKDFGVAMVPRSVAVLSAEIAFSEREGAPIPWQFAVGHDARRTPSNAARTIIEALRAGGNLTRATPPRRGPRR